MTDKKEEEEGENVEPITYGFAVGKKQTLKARIPTPIGDPKTRGAHSVVPYGKRFTVAVPPMQVKPKLPFQRELGPAGRSSVVH